MWRKDWDALGLDTLGDGSVVVAAGGCDFYPGSRASSPSFSFAVTKLRVAGEGDLLAQVERLRKTLGRRGAVRAAEAACRGRRCRAASAWCPGEGGKARDDVLAGLKRRGWAGRIVWAFAPVQDRHAAPAITRALQDLAACEEVEVIVVARGGGSLADLFAFCDETLCRTVALLRVPVISSVGHHTDRTLIDDVSAVACSTPTHAAEAAVPVNCAEARAKLHGLAARLEHRSRLAIVERARVLARLSRAPADHVAPAPRAAAPARARAARERPPPGRAGHAPHLDHGARARAQGARRRGRRARPARARPSSGCGSRSRRTSRSGRSSAATPWSRTRAASRSRRRPPRASRRR
jgi:exodeoxyribonuclease VII large subunit